jgi:hypothetical protein
MYLKKNCQLNFTETPLDCSAQVLCNLVTAEVIFKNKWGSNEVVYLLLVHGCLAFNFNLVFIVCRLKNFREGA